MPSLHALPSSPLSHQACNNAGMASDAKALSHAIGRLPLVDRGNQIQPAGEGYGAAGTLRQGEACLAQAASAASTSTSATTAAPTPTTPSPSTVEHVVAEVAALPFARQEQLLHWLLRELRAFAVPCGANSLPVCLLAPQHIAQAFRLLGSLGRADEAVALAVTILEQTSFDIDALFPVMRRYALLPYFAALRSDEALAAQLYATLMALLPSPSELAPPSTGLRAVQDVMRFLYDHVDYVRLSENALELPVRLERAGRGDGADIKLLKRPRGGQETA